MSPIAKKASRGDANVGEDSVHQATLEGGLVHGHSLHRQRHLGGTQARLPIRELLISLTRVG